MSSMIDTSKSYIESSDGRSKINPKVPLVWMGVLGGLFGIFQLLNPLGFFEQYFPSTSVQKMHQADKMLVVGMFQQWGIWNIMIAGLCSIACRVGSDRTRMHLNVAGALSTAVNLFLLLAGFSTWTRLGCSAAGLAFNGVLSVLTVILFGLGASISFDLAPLKKPVYWASCAMAVVGLCYSLGCFFIPEKLMNSYSVVFHSEEVRAIVMSIFHYGWTGVFFMLSALLVAGMMATDFMYMYALNRWIAIIEMGMVMVVATNVAWWNSMDEDWAHSFIIGQWSNCFMCLCYGMLTYVPMVMLDNKVAPSVRVAIAGGTSVEGAPRSTTLLSPNSQEKERAGMDAYKAPLVSSEVTMEA